MSFRKFNIKSKDGPRGVPSWDKSGVGSKVKPPIQYAGIENSVEVERPIFRAVMDLIKADTQNGVDIENFAPAIGPQAYLYRLKTSSGAVEKFIFAVACYPKLSPAKYYLILHRLSKTLQGMIEKEIKRVQTNYPTTNHRTTYEEVNKATSKPRPAGHSAASWGQGSHRHTGGKM